MGPGTPAAVQPSGALAVPPHPAAGMMRLHWRVSELTGCTITASQRRQGDRAGHRAAAGLLKARAPSGPSARRDGQPGRSAHPSCDHSMPLRRSAVALRVALALLLAAVCLPLCAAQGDEFTRPLFSYSECGRCGAREGNRRCRLYSLRVRPPTRRRSMPPLRTAGGRRLLAPGPTNKNICRFDALPRRRHGHCQDGVRGAVPAGHTRTAGRRGRELGGAALWRRQQGAPLHAVLPAALLCCASCLPGTVGWSSVCRGLRVALPPSALRATSFRSGAGACLPANRRRWCKSRAAGDCGQGGAVRGGAHLLRRRGRHEL